MEFRIWKFTYRQLEFSIFFCVWCYGQRANTWTKFCENIEATKKKHTHTVHYLIERQQRKSAMRTHTHTHTHKGTMAAAQAHGHHKMRPKRLLFIECILNEFYEQEKLFKLSAAAMISISASSPGDEGQIYIDLISQIGKIGGRHLEFVISIFELLAVAYTRRSESESNH